MKAEVSGHNIAYHREGAGETVIMVHGISTYSFIWRKIVPILSEKYDVITVDLLGCGESDKPADGVLSVKNHSKWLKEFTEEIGVEKIHLVGHDVGGGIVQIFGVNYPEIVIDATLINSVGYDFWPVQPILSMRTPVIRKLALATLDHGLFKVLVKRGMYYNEKVTPELMNLFLKPLKNAPGRKAFLNFAKSLNNRELLEIENELRNLTMPELIVRGDADVYLSPGIAQKLHNEIPGSRLEIIPTGGHFIQEDEPELLGEIVMNFFEKNEAG
jgi:pimeloyl-ACP methyl ester carboxylesterase